MWGLIPVFDCSQLLLLCPSQCKPSVRLIPTTDARVLSPQPTMSDQAFVTLATNDNYAKGAMVLGQSLRNHNTTRKLVVLLGPHVAELCRDALHSVFDEVIMVNVMDSGDAANLALMKRPDLGVTITKLHCWTLVQYSKCVFMDADTLVLSNIDELFEREELSAAPDPGWPDCFNSGVFVFRPSNETHKQLLTFCAEKGSFDGGDQGVLNSYFNTWATADISKHLPFIYNLSSIAIYSYLPAFKQYGHDAKVVHFLGKVKPWNYSYDAQRGEVRGHSASPDPCHMHPDYLLQWWQLYATSVLPLLQKAYGDAPFSSGFVDQSSPDKLHEGVREQAKPSPPPSQRVSSEERKQRWEAGQIDYLESHRCLCHDLRFITSSLQCNQLPYCLLSVYATSLTVTAASDTFL
ncbi:Glycogenin-1 [Ataeniobius toweri]|uniref:glycogenin glucosyltransferase n=1 Tax=Ataeniobius toweri TaxID=208326 RepID=A0ABU7BV79_9TELE|nr:Glycogenin-1 [Ataeniobius toweri]